MVSILLLQDLIAIVVLIAMGITENGDEGLFYIIRTVLALPAILLWVFLVERFILKRIFSSKLIKFTEMREYTLLVAVAWCLGIAELSKALGLSYEIGAFIAGAALANSHLARRISNQIQPIRDFFLVFFFFLIGANFDLRSFDVILMPALILTIVFVASKPVIFRYLLQQISEIKGASGEIGLRLGQLSEFSLLVASVASRSELISQPVAHLIQAVTMLMFVDSSYLVVTRYPRVVPNSN